MKKILLLALLFTWTLQAQQLPLFEDSELNTKSSKVSSDFNETVKRANAYFATRDIDKKGSGYKPFKRWENHWRHYTLPDGSIIPAERLWTAWEKKQSLAAKTKATSNWVEMGPFDQSSKSGQGRLNTIIVDPNNSNIIYVGAPAGGIWKSTDAGVNWTALTDDLPQIGVSGIAIDPNNSDIIYISTGDDDAGDSFSIGVLKSINGGQTWNTTGSLLGNPTSSNEIVIDPTDSNKIWVATSSGLFLSTNGGTSWDRKQTGHIRDFKLKPGDPNTIYAVSSNTFFRSTNGGTSFTSNPTGIPFSSNFGRLRVEVTPASPNNVYVLGARPANQNWAFQGIYVSTNSGLSFSKTAENDDIFGSTQAWYDLAFTISPTDANIMFVGVLDIWRSSDGGNNFTKINDWRVVDSKFTHADIHFMRYYGNTMYAGTDGGIYKTSNVGISFTDLTENLSISQFYKISVSKQTSSKLAGGLQDNGGFALSADTWHNYHGGDGMDAASDPSNENVFYGLTQNGGFLTRTSNGGITGTTITTAPAGGNWVTPLVMNKGSELYAGYDQLYRLENGGWSQISNHGFNGNLEVIEIDPSNNDKVYVGRGLNLFFSSDRGDNFVTRSPGQTGLTGNFISSIEVHNSNSDIIWVTTSGFDPQFPSSGQTGGGVYKSIDGGQTFTNITGGLPGEAKLVVRHHPFSTNNSIYLGTALGVYHFNDDTNTWEVFSTNLPNVAVTDIEINPYDATITASTYGRSVWQSAIPAITIPQNDADLLKITSPSSGVVCGTALPKISVVNNGSQSLTSLTINYNIDGGANQTFNWSGSIASNETGSIDLPSISASEGEHTLNVELVQTNDANLFNNSSSTNFEVNKSGVGQEIYTFGDANPGSGENAEPWITSSSFWSIGTPTTTNFNGLVASGYVSNPSGNYADNSVALLTSPCYDMTTLVDPVLKFKMAFDIELNWDVLYMQYSIDGGNTWEVLGSANDPNWYNSNFQNAGRPLTIGRQWTGTDTTLKDYSYDLAAFTDEPSMVFRFVFATDQNTNGEGAVIDDFTIDASQVLSVDELDSANFAIYPNPSDQIFMIDRASFFGEDMNIDVYDVTGKLVLKRTNITDRAYPLDMSDVSKGVYFMRITIDNSSLVKKLILK